MKVNMKFEFTEEDRKALPCTMKAYAGVELMSYTQMKEWVSELVSQRCAHARKKFASMQTSLVFTELKERAQKAREMADGASTPSEVLDALSEVEGALQKLNELGDTSAVVEFSKDILEEDKEEGDQQEEGWEPEELLEGEEEGAEEAE